MRIQRQRHVGKAALETSFSVARLEHVARARAAQIDHPEALVTSLKATEPSRGMCLRIQPPSRTPKPEPVTT